MVRLTMKPRITLLTIGVNDLERSLNFYRDGLGFPTEGIVGTEFEHGAVAFFELHNRLKLAIWPRKDIAHERRSRSGRRAPRNLPSATMWPARQK